MGKTEGKIALVTGASRGVGFAIARALLDGGASVVVCATDPGRLQEAVSQLGRGRQERVTGIACNVREHGQVRSMMEDVQRRTGGLDILVNNAGIGIFNSVDKLSEEEWRATIETNLSGVFYCCREAIPLMKRRGGGYIVNIGSLAGKNPFAGGAAYNASKFGLLGFSEALMQDVRYDHIRVTCVMPGSVNTEFGRSGQESPATTWKLLPEDVAGVVMDLLEMDPRALSSRVELRPSEPRK